jgi:hypothetical protein
MWSAVLSPFPLREAGAPSWSPHARQHTQHRSRRRQQLPKPGWLPCQRVLRHQHAPGGTHHCLGWWRPQRPLRAPIWSLFQCMEELRATRANRSATPLFSRLPALSPGWILTLCTFRLRGWMVRGLGSWSQVLSSLSTEQLPSTEHSERSRLPSHILEPALLDTHHEAAHLKPRASLGSPRLSPLPAEPSRHRASLDSEPSTGLQPSLSLSKPISHGPQPCTLTHCQN